MPSVPELAEIERLTFLNPETIQDWIYFSWLTWAPESAALAFGPAPHAQRPIPSLLLPSFEIPLLTKRIEEAPATSLHNLPVRPFVDAGARHRPYPWSAEAKPILPLPPLWIALGLSACSAGPESVQPELIAPRQGVWY
jgi:hypothetical protein